jgi:hypothetical protein
VKAKERFESVNVTPPELIEDVALSVPHRRSPFYLLLLPMQQKGYMRGAERPADASAVAVVAEPSPPS